MLHSTLRAGIPVLIAPLMGDQHFHAKLVEARHLGRDCGPMASLTAEKLVEALQGMDELHTENARRFAAKIQDGLALACCGTL